MDLSIINSKLHTQEHVDDEFKDISSNLENTSLSFFQNPNAI